MPRATGSKCVEKVSCASGTPPCSKISGVWRCDKRLYARKYSSTSPKRRANYTAASQSRAVPRGLAGRVAREGGTTGLAEMAGGGRMRRTAPLNDGQCPKKEDGERWPVGGESDHVMLGIVAGRRSVVV